MSGSPAWLLDASVVIKLLTDEPDSPRALTLLRHDLVAPDLMPTECANALWKKRRLGLLDGAEALMRLEELRGLPVQLLPTRDLLPGALGRAIRQNHPVYDCVYLEAAAMTGLTLVTADRRLTAVNDGAAKVILLSDLPA